LAEYAQSFQRLRANVEELVHAAARQDQGAVRAKALPAPVGMQLALASEAEHHLVTVVLVQRRGGAGRHGLTPYGQLRQTLGLACPGGMVDAVNGGGCGWGLFDHGHGFAFSLFKHWMKEWVGSAATEEPVWRRRGDFGTTTCALTLPTKFPQSSS
jgi:hypothetical protein